MVWIIVSFEKNKWLQPSQITKPNLLLPEPWRWQHPCLSDCTWEPRWWIPPCELPGEKGGRGYRGLLEAWWEMQRWKGIKLLNTKRVNAAQKSMTDIPDLLAQQHQQTADSFLVLLQAVLLSLVEFLAWTLGKKWQKMRMNVALRSNNGTYIKTKLRQTNVLLWSKSWGAGDTSIHCRSCRLFWTLSQQGVKFKIQRLLP